MIHLLLGLAITPLTTDVKCLILKLNSLCHRIKALLLSEVVVTAWLWREFALIKPKGSCAISVTRKRTCDNM